MKTTIFYENNLGYIKIQNCKPRQVYINYIGAYYLKRNNKTRKLEEIYINN